MRSFNDFTSNSDNNESNYMNILKSFASKYEGASQSDIVLAILSEAEKGRRKGTLKDEDIDRFVEMLKPMLNSSQLKELDSVIAKIKSIK